MAVAKIRKITAKTTMIRTNAEEKCRQNPI